MWNFFEQPWTLLGAAVIVLLAVLTFRSVWYEKRRWWQWLLPVGVAALALGLDFAVATDLEKVNGVIRAGIEAGENEDCAAIARLIADDYEDSFHKSRQALLARCRTRLVPPAIQKIRKIDTLVDLTPPRAVATFTMWVRFDPNSFWARSYKPNALVKVQVHLRKRPDKTWLVQRIEVLEVDKIAVGWGVAKDSARPGDPRDGDPASSGMPARCRFAPAIETVRRANVTRSFCHLYTGRWIVACAGTTPKYAEKLLSRPCRV